MLKLTGILRKEEIKEFPRRNGETGREKILYIEPEGYIRSIMVHAPDTSLPLGEIGEMLELSVKVYAYPTKDGKKAFVKYEICLDK